MLAIRFHNQKIESCLFFKKDKKWFFIIAIHVDDINLFGHTTTIKQTIDMLRKAFEMKDLGQTHFCLGFNFTIY
jgi:hypothetical protein